MEVLASVGSITFLWGLAGLIKPHGPLKPRWRSGALITFGFTLAGAASADGEGFSWGGALVAVAFCTLVWSIVGLSRPHFPFKTRPIAAAGLALSILLMVPATKLLESGLTPEQLAAQAEAAAQYAQKRKNKKILDILADGPDVLKAERSGMQAVVWVQISNAWDSAGYVDQLARNIISVSQAMRGNDELFQDHPTTRFILTAKTSTGTYSRAVTVDYPTSTLSNLPAHIGDYSYTDVLDLAEAVSSDGPIGQEVLNDWCREATQTERGVFFCAKWLGIM